jgi:hypothetical protein
MAMLRHRAACSSVVETQRLVSARAPAEVLYRDELAVLAAGEGLSIAYAFTRGRPDAWAGLAGYSEAELLSSGGSAPTRHPRVFVFCLRRSAVRRRHGATARASRLRPECDSRSRHRPGREMIV